ncbi:hypothetical protein IFM89_019561 [Coptis chinensis]|uniref:Protein kinase domain-containing protein n=1 Tax=Coptis chinensis TaxID=261450 RepID=A0A835H6H8_9MAGN|nr:hypothetical protein IFM89_019561 [Coptis chinensis]
MADFRAVPTHDGEFVAYNMLGNVFEITSKYIPPILPVGSGAYGVVCSILNSETNEMVAIKKISDAFDNNTDAKRTLKRLNFFGIWITKINTSVSNSKGAQCVNFGLNKLCMKQVIGIRDVIPPPIRRAFSDVYIVTELMDTDLHQIIRSKQALSAEHCQYFLYQILCGLKYIHSANIIHRDLKPSNLLLNANCDLKICDFGLARLASEDDFMTEYVVTRWKTLFPGKDQVHQMRLLTELLGTPSDSELGFIQNDNARKYIKQLKKCPRLSLASVFPHVHSEAIDLVEKMLTFDPTQRITVEEALAHPYLARLHNTDYEPICPKPFSFDFEKQPLMEEEMKEMIYEEALSFNPGGMIMPSTAYKVGQVRYK